MTGGAGVPDPEEGQSPGEAREARTRERLARAAARAAEDSELAASLPPGAQRDRLEHAVATHERAVALHEEAAHLQRVHQEHESQRAEDGASDR